MAPHPKVVFFDLDGVLVDSQGAENDALLHLAHLIGAPITAADAERLFTGRRVQESVDHLARLATKPLPPDPVGVVRARCEALIAGRLTAPPGVEAALKAITLPKYVVSNSPLGMIRDRLAMTGLDGHFGDTHFSAYELRVWKPDPRLYAMAAEAVSIDPAHVLVVEDSRVGVEAAAAAGMRVMWYRPRPLPGEADVPGAQTLTHMDDLARTAATWPKPHTPHRTPHNTAPSTR